MCSVFVNYTTLTKIQEKRGVKNNTFLVCCISDALTLQCVYNSLEVEINKLNDKMANMQTFSRSEATVSTIKIETPMETENDYIYESLDIYQKQTESQDGKYYNVFY